MDLAGELAAFGIDRTAIVSALARPTYDAVYGTVQATLIKHGWTEKAANAETGEGARTLLVNGNSSQGRDNTAGDLTGRIGALAVM